MNVLVISPSRLLRDIFISELIPKGIHVTWSENLDEVREKLEAKKLPQLDIVVFEAITKFDVFTYMKSLRYLLQNQKIVFVLYSEIKSKEDIFEYLKLGIGAFLVKPLDRSLVFSVLTKAYERFKGAPPERKLVRVEIEDGSATVEFTSLKGIRVISDLIDISVGGCAFRYLSKDEDAFSVGEELEEILLIFHSPYNIETTVRGKIHSKNPEKKIGVIIFTELTQDAIQKISKFIFHKVSLDYRI